MNITEIARRLRVTPDELRERLPELGFDVGKKAIKVDRRLADRIMRRWKEEAWKKKEIEKEKKKMEIRQKVKSGEIEGSRKITLTPSLTVRELADKLNLPVNDVISELMKGGILASINERIDFDTAAVIAEDLGYIAEKESQEQKEEQVSSALETLKETVLRDEEGLEERPPVVVVMGHVDHGKTTLLDTVRQTAVAEGESGGITQHIGAYQAEKNGRKITFIDTPGHEAFTMMRSRGARAADIAVIVVAADDGVKPQTEEVINIVQAAKLPHVVAINKMDKEGANPDMVKTQLSERKLIPEEWGGQTPMVPISAKAGTGIDDLLEHVLFVADDHKDMIRAKPDRRAIGTVIESHVSKGEGPVATVLIQAGTLRPGDTLGIDGALYGRVRVMKDFLGASVDEAPPGMPVKIIGFKSAPTVGDVVEVPENAKDLSAKKAAKRNLAQPAAAPVQTAGEEEDEEEKQQLVTLVLKTDVLGSQEAILGQFEQMRHPDVGVKVVSKGLGNVSDSDILNAETNDAIVVAFNVRVTPTADDLAREKTVEIRKYSVIYDLVDDVKAELKKKLKPEIVRTDVGKVEVKAVFKEGKDFQVVGGVVMEGKAKKGEKARIMRDGEPIAQGEITELQRNKQPAQEVPGGSECGIKFEGKPFIQEGDVLEIFHEEAKEQELGF